MSKVRECFACGTLLATSERQRVEVRHKRDKVRVAEVCRECWWKLRGEREVRVVKGRKTYELRVRRLQLALFRDTARAVIAGGPTDG